MSRRPTLDGCVRGGLADCDLVPCCLQRGFDFCGNGVWHAFINLESAPQSKEALVEIVPTAGPSKPSSSPLASGGNCRIDSLFSFFQGFVLQLDINSRAIDD